MAAPIVIANASAIVSLVTGMLELSEAKADTKPSETAENDETKYWDKLLTVLIDTVTATKAAMTNTVCFTIFGQVKL